MADSLTIEIKGIPELQAKFKQLESEITKVLSDAISKGGELVTKDAQGRVSVVTGNLKKNIKEQKKTATSTMVQVDVGVIGVPYAARQEYGYVGPDSLGRRFHQPPRPYLRNSLDENEAKIRSLIDSELKSLIGRYK